MNRATNRRALAVYLAICLLYVSVAFRVPEKLSMKRIVVKPALPSNGMNIHGSFDLNRTEAFAEEAIEEKAAGSPPAHAAVPEASPPVFEATPVRTPRNVESLNAPGKLYPVITARESASVEPHFFISIPITCHAIEEGWLDRETLIFSKKDGQNNSWLKPLDILKQQDEDSIKALVTLIGKSKLKEFLRKEAVDIKEDLSPDDMMLGRGYVIEKKKLLSLYDRFVHEECNALFPLSLAQGGVVKGKGGFRLVSSGEAARIRTEKEGEEWHMPNLAGFTIKSAIDKLAVHTSRIRIYGSGFVVDQSPKPFERLKPDSECAIYGRLASE